MGKEFKQGDLVEIKTASKILKGNLISQSEDFVTIKFENGYNTCFNKKEINSISLIKKFSPEKVNLEKVKKKKDLPTILIIHTGGTISSKVDYRTGAVISKFSPEELINMFPEMKSIANIESKQLFQIFSEDIESEHWQELAKEIQKNLKKEIVGIIIAHGTDTMHFTSAALSFMIQNSSIPIILVGAQRSSDRGSSDAALNLVCAAQFIIKSGFKGIGVCMHTNQEDKFCYIHPGTNVRKLHTSRRDAFKTINTSPYAKIDFNGNIDWLNKPHQKEGKLSINTNFDPKIALIKIYPGISSKILENYSHCKGIILEGTGLGHLPSKLIKTLENLSKNSVIVMCSQCIFGRVDLDVYSTGIDIQQAGVISGDSMLSETAYVKIGWLLGNIKDRSKIKKEMQIDYIGELPKIIDEKSSL